MHTCHKVVQHARLGTYVHALKLLLCVGCITAWVAPPLGKMTLPKHLLCSTYVKSTYRDSTALLYNIILLSVMTYVLRLQNAFNVK